jgi:DNA-directed RNA polymerase subunit beta
MAKFDVIDLSGKVIVTKDKRITAKHIRELANAGIDMVSVGDDFLLGRVLATNVVSPDGELVARANDEITEDSSTSCVTPASPSSARCT